MNQIKTGKFIADERKRKGYTQVELADKLGISNKTISKWERGNGFPDVSLLLPLCEELEISINELLTGERIAVEDYRRKAEENMVDIIKKNKKSVEERIITVFLTISIFVIAVAGCIMGKVFLDPGAQAAIGIMSLISITCIVVVWIATSVCLKKK